jgi:hypothetical protein
MQADFSDFLQVSFTNILKKCGKRSSDQGHLCWCMLWRYPPLNACYSKCLRKNDSLSRVKNVCISFRIVQFWYLLVALQHQVKNGNRVSITSFQSRLCDVCVMFLGSFWIQKVFASWRAGWKLRIHRSKDHPRTAFGETVQIRKVGLPESIMHFWMAVKISGKKYAFPICIFHSRQKICISICIFDGSKIFPK